MSVDYRQLRPTEIRVLLPSGELRVAVPMDRVLYFNTQQGLFAQLEDGSYRHFVGFAFETVCVPSLVQHA
jgi:hypothetical protein